MREIWKYVRVCTLMFVCMLFLGAGMKAQAAPAQVTGLEQNGDSISWVKFKWDAVIGDNIRYEVQLSSSSSFSDVRTEDAYTNTEVLLSSLSAGNKYYVRVRAYDNSNGTKDYGSYSKALEVVTTPDKDNTQVFQQTKATTTSITLKWKKNSGANAYQIEYYKTGNSGATKTVKLDNVQTYTAKKLSKDSEYYFRLYPVLKSASGYRAVSSSGDSLYPSVLPGKMKGLKASLRYPTSTSIDLSWDRFNNADGYQYQVYTASGKKLLDGEESSYSSSSYPSSNKKLDKAQFLKVRVRAFVNYSSKNRGYGDWSNWIYTSKQPKISIKNVKGGQKLTWNKVSGADSYTIEVSTDSSSGYKKVKTIKGNSITVKKCGKSALKTGRYYYYTVVANKKVGKKTYHGSRTQWYSFYYR